MSMNRAMRRKQVRTQMQEWSRANESERVRRLTQNGITQKDLADWHKKGYEEGYLFASTNFFKQMYAAITKELLDQGNSRDEIVLFLHAVDRRFSVIFDADDEIDEIYDQIGVRINVAKDNFDRISEVL